jgi:hypothetical protein
MWHSILCHYTSYVWDLVPTHLVFMFAPESWCPETRVWHSSTFLCALDHLISQISCFVDSTLKFLVDLATFFSSSYTSALWASAWADSLVLLDSSLSTKDSKILSFARASFLKVITSSRRFPSAIWQLSSFASFWAFRALLRIRPYKTEERTVAEPSELFQLKCPSHALEATTHLNWNNQSVPQI